MLQGLDRDFSISRFAYNRSFVWRTQWAGWYRAQGTVRFSCIQKADGRTRADVYLVLEDMDVV